MMGARIAALRREKHMSQQELARLLDVSSSAVGMYEQGRREPSGENLVRLAKIFGVSTDYLLTGEAVGAGDAARLLALLEQASAHLGAQVRLRASDGTERAMTQEDVALLLAALLG